MIINTKRLRLRPFEKKDINPYFNIAQDSSVKKYVYPFYVDSKENAKLRIKAFQRVAMQSEDFIFAIVEKANNALIGMISAIHIRSNTLDISLFMAESCRNRGYAKEALIALLFKLMEMKKAYNFEFFIDDGNVPADLIMKRVKTEAKKIGLKIKEERLDSEGTNYSLKV